MLQFLHYKALFDLKSNLKNTAKMLVSAITKSLGL